MINELNYDGIDFPLSQKCYNKVEKQNSNRINVFGYENGQPFQFSSVQFSYFISHNLKYKTKNKNYMRYVYTSFLIYQV